MDPNAIYYHHHHNTSLVLPPLLNLPAESSNTQAFENPQQHTTIYYHHNDNATATTTTIVDDDNDNDNIVSHVNNTSISISFRQARQRSYFAVQHGQTLYCEPYKYNVRLSGVENFVHSPDALYSFELHMRSKMNPNTTEYMPLALQMEKQMKIRGSPHDCMDYRIYFAIDSRAYAGSLFFVMVRDSNGISQCTTSDFVIGGRGKKRTETKKRKQQLLARKTQQPDDEEEEENEDTVVE